MYITCIMREDSWHFEDKNLVITLLERIEELFKDPNYYHEDTERDSIKVILTEKDGNICSIQRDGKRYSLQIKYDTELLKAAVQKFNKKPGCLALMIHYSSRREEFEKDFTRDVERELKPEREV